MDSHRDLVVWQRAMSLVTEIYRIIESFPRKETYGLAGQLCRAGVSVPSNIAEGKGRLSKREFIQFLSRARGSLLEVETQLEIARNIKYLSQTEFDLLFELAASVGRPLNGLISSVRAQLPKPSPRAKSQQPRAKK